MQINSLLGYAQAEACSRNPAYIRGPVEGLKQVFQVLRWNADPGILHPNRDLCVVLGQLYRDERLPLRILERVVQQIADRLPQQAVIKQPVDGR